MGDQNRGDYLPTDEPIDAEGVKFLGDNETGGEKNRLTNFYDIAKAVSIDALSCHDDLSLLVEAVQRFVKLPDVGKKEIKDAVWIAVYEAVEQNYGNRDSGKGYDEYLEERKKMLASLVEIDEESAKDALMSAVARQCTEDGMHADEMPHEHRELTDEEIEKSYVILNREEVKEVVKREILQYLTGYASTGQPGVDYLTYCKKLIEEKGFNVEEIIERARKELEKKIEIAKEDVQKDKEGKFSGHYDYQRELDFYEKRFGEIESLR